MFVSFGLPTPDDQYVYVFQDKSEGGKKRTIIYRWKEIEEIALRKVLNMDIGLEIITVDKKLKSFNLLTTDRTSILFDQLDIINKLAKKKDKDGKNTTTFKLIRNLKNEF